VWTRPGSGVCSYGPEVAIGLNERRPTRALISGVDQLQRQKRTNTRYGTLTIWNFFIAKR
jgi:hypothetical protein